jgi:hypothetical protein
VRNGVADGLLVLHPLMASGKIRTRVNPAMSLMHKNTLSFFPVVHNKNVHRAQSLFSVRHVGKERVPFGAEHDADPQDYPSTTAGKTFL